MSYKSISGVRIALDMELFFKDKRRKCYHYIDFSRNESVGDVCNDIKSCFDLKTDIYLEVNNCYVPENQDVRVLYNEDVVRVIDADAKYDLPRRSFTDDGQSNITQDAEILANALNEKKMDKLDKQEGNESDENIATKPKKRKKSRKAEETAEKKYFKDVDEDENPRKKRKPIKKFSDNIPSEHTMYMPSKKNEREINTMDNSLVVLKNSTCKDEITMICGNNNTEPEAVLEPEENTAGNVFSSNTEFPHKQSCKLDREIGSCISSASLKLNIHNYETEVILQNDRGDAEENLDKSTCKKKRRRRSKKPPGIYHNHFEQYTTESAVLTKKSLKTPHHIKFEDEEEENNNNSSNNTKLPNVCGDDALDRCISLQLCAETELSAVGDRTSVQNEYDVKSDCDVPINNTSVKRNSDISENFVVQTSSTPMIFECKRTNRLSPSQSVRKETESEFSKYPLLNNSPKVNDIIAFKTLKMDSDYCPCISQYISAKVLQVSEEDSLVELRILNGHEELKEPKGKFSLEEENEVIGFEEKINDTIEIQLADLLNVRLLFP